MYPLVILALVIVAFIGNALADSEFTKPPPGEADDSYDDNVVYDAGVSVTWKWTSDLLNKDLLLWQIYPEADNNYKRILSSSQYSMITWTPSLDWVKNLRDDEVAVVYFLLYSTGETVPAARSHYFNITMPVGGIQTSTSTTAAEKTEVPVAKDFTTIEMTAASATESAGSSSTSTDSSGADSISRVSIEKVAGIALGTILVAISTFGGL
ncbi:hypothetical protein G7Z17_g3789 [Cylindrodendrum hubeiense]|uniref:Uncharacterized protein n=1 Tax=Cylindrodendrum hubeiense TaxID=595255 RepID=A0A9P5HF59_9HYPO|nr:hypothetical protein G7Z17_g3789 [Cylindrodendrum hubeiense]